MIMVFEGTHYPREDEHLIAEATAAVCDAICPTDEDCTHAPSEDDVIFDRTGEWQGSAHYAEDMADWLYCTFG